MFNFQNNSTGKNFVQKRCTKKINNELKSLFDSELVIVKSTPLHSSASLPGSSSLYTKTIS